MLKILQGSWVPTMMSPSIPNFDPDIGPPHADSLYADRKAEALIEVIVKGVESEKWVKGSLVTRMMVGDRFALPMNEAIIALSLLEQRGYLRKEGNSYYRS